MNRIALATASALAFATFALATEEPQNHDVSAGKAKAAASTDASAKAAKKYRPWNPDFGVGKIRPEGSTIDIVLLPEKQIEPDYGTGDDFHHPLLSDDARDAQKQRSTQADQERKLGIPGDEIGGSHIVIRSPDINADGTVDFMDYIAVLSQWGACPSTEWGERTAACDADLNDDGRVGFEDLLLVLAYRTDWR